jgi:2'-5' RNA ligase
MRLFVAVNFSEGIREAIADVLTTFPISDPPWRWSSPESWHITLKFIGAVKPKYADGIATALAATARLHAPFEIALGAFDAFPSLRRPRVLFFRVETGADALVALAADIDGTLAETAGIEPDTKPFRAHATVARIKQQLPPGLVDHLQAVPALSDASQTVDSIALMRSHLSPLKSLVLDPSRGRPGDGTVEEDGCMPAIYEERGRYVQEGFQYSREGRPGQGA